jgi:hypothetical protein
MVNHQAVLIAEGTREPAVSAVYGFWVQDVGSAERARNDELLLLFLLSGPSSESGFLGTGAPLLRA